MEVECSVPNTYPFPRFMMYTLCTTDVQLVYITTYYHAPQVPWWDRVIAASGRGKGEGGGSAGYKSRVADPEETEEEEHGLQRRGSIFDLDDDEV